MKILLKQTTLLLLLLTATMSAQTIRYVRPGYNSTGASWDNASGNLQAMINASAAGDQVWVAGGTYQLAADQSFIMKEGVIIYGGFPNAYYASMSNRDFSAHPTILKGNNRPVVKNNNNALTTAAVLDGFTLIGGNHSGDGGGMYNRFASPTISNCIFSLNTISGRGAGMYNDYASPVISNSTFTNNTASSEGGGLYSIDGSPVISNCSIRNNSANNGAGIYKGYGAMVISNCSVTGNYSYQAGGGIYSYAGSLKITKCKFTSNQASVQGGGIFNQSTATVTDCAFSYNYAQLGGAVYDRGVQSFLNVTFTKNTATSRGGALYVLYAAPKLYNCIVWGNESSYGGKELFNDANGQPPGTNNTVTADNCLINVDAASVNGLLNHQNTISGNPLFTKWLQMI